jgi:hypothetical protein
MKLFTIHKKKDSNAKEFELQYVEDVFHEGTLDFICRKLKSIKLQPSVVTIFGKKKSLRVSSSDEQHWELLKKYGFKEVRA